MAKSKKKAAPKRATPKKAAPKKVTQGAAKNEKVGVVMDEFKDGTLRSGSRNGPKVKSRKQAMAIALSEARDDRKQEASKKAVKRTKKYKKKK